MEEQKRPAARKIIGGIVGFLAGFALVYLVFGGSLGGNSDEKALKNLQAVSAELNKSCPMQIDAYTVLKTTVALPPRTLRYMYTVTLPDGFDVETVKANFIPTVKQQVRTLPDMQTLRDAETVFSYSYDTPDGSHLFDFEVTPEDYE